MKYLYLSKWMGGCCLLLLLSTPNLSAQVQELFQGFEGSANDNWNYTTTPDAYAFPDDDDFWTASTANNQLQPASGQVFWFMRDLDNPNSGNGEPHLMDFEFVDVQLFNENSLSFKYNVEEFESADSIGYILETSPGTDFDMANYVDLSRDTDGWVTEFLNLPPGISTVRLRFRVVQNGNSDWAGLDDITLTSSVDDILPPFVSEATILNENTIRLNYSEPMDVASVEDPMAYTTTAAISTVTYVEPGGAEFPYVDIQFSDNFVDGTTNSLSVSMVTDDAGNPLLEPFVFEWVYNNSTPELVITEVLYNPPGQDELEFIEIFNAGTASAALGGLTVSSEFSFTFPELNLAAGEVALLAREEVEAEDAFGLTFFDWGTEGLNNGGDVIVIRNFSGTLIDSVSYLDEAPWPAEADGDGPSMELLDPSLDNNDGSNWFANTETLPDSDIAATPGTYNPASLPVISFEEETLIVDEAAGTVSLNLTISNANDAPAEAVISAVGASNAVAGEDYNLSTNTFTFPANSNDALAVEVELLDNPALGGRYLILEITSLTNASAGSNEEITVLIQDNDLEAPEAPLQPSISLNHLGSYESGTVAEIVAHDPGSQRLFVTNSDDDRLDIVDFATPDALSPVNSISMLPFGGGINSVAVNDGVVAVALEAETVTDNGSVAFFDTDGNLLSQVEVGPLPDMLAFTPDGSKVLTANEGEPNEEYTVDPEGSVSIIDLSNGAASLTNADVTTIDFNSFNAEEQDLKDEGVRIFGPGATVAQDLEPEFITISDDGSLAYANCQENNALVLIDIESATALDVLPLGYKDWTQEGIVLDASNRIDDIFFANWPIRGMYQPDAIDYFTVGGQSYLISANEGDARDYDGFSEEFRVGDEEIPLDPTAFPNAEYLENEALLGRLRVTSANGDTDGDGDYDELFSYGARSFSIWNAATGELLYDSGSELELITAADPVFGAIFNATDDENEFKNRSDDKGPEPEAVTVADINGVPYAFIALERIGGIMVYNVANPEAPSFVQYINTRTVNELGGDLAPEDIKIVSPGNSPDGQFYAVVSYEVSGTVGVFEIATPATVAFAETTVEVMEGAGAIELPVSIEQAGTLDGTFSVSVADASTAISGEDYNLGTTSIDIPAGFSGDTTLSLEILDNSSRSGKYLVLEIDAAASSTGIGEDDAVIVLIADKDDTAPVAQAEPDAQLNHLGSFSLPEGAAAEIIAYDAGTGRLFASNSEFNELQILDFGANGAISAVAAADLSPYGGGINSVAVNDGLVAVAMEAETVTDNGSVVFFDTDGTFLNQVEVGPLPDMLTFTPDGSRILTANEGEPNDDYTVDPEGSVSIVDVSAGAMMASVTTLGLDQFNADSTLLTEQGVRIFGPGATVAQDLEPEFITVSDDGSTAYVNCQENNALILVDLTAETITGILPLGFKDWTQEGVTLDASNRIDNIFFSNWPIKGMYQPDGFDYFSVGGQSYLISANEGDARDYDGYTEEFRVGDDEIVLDPTAFPGAEYLKDNALLGRLRITNANGDTDGDGDFDELFAYGARSFTIWDAVTGELVYDSGNDLEQITAADPVYGAIFNATDDENEFKNRSDDKGPEPEAVTVAEFNGNTYGFIALERIGGIMMYELNDPTAPEFVQYINTRTVDSLGGDLAPEDLVFVGPDQSADGRAYLLASYEVSGSIAAFDLGRPATVSFAETTTEVEEGSGSLQIELAVEEAGSIGSRATVRVNAASTAEAGEDFTIATTEFDFAEGDTLSQFLELDILDNSSLSGKYLVLEIDPAGTAITGETSRHILLISDDDDAAPMAAAEPGLQLTHLGSYLTGGGDGTAEIVAYDGSTQRLFLTNGENNTVDILDYSDPSNLLQIASIDISAYGDGINSVAVSNGIVAAAVEADGVDENGTVAFFDTDGNFLNSVAVGVLPDMVTFTPDGTKAIVANEGEPNEEYTIDPEGSISIIDLGMGAEMASVTNLDFTGFNAQQDDLTAAGVRIFGPGATVAQDLEPEYITVSDDNTTAYAVAQENNAIIIIDLIGNTIANILPLGSKDWTQEGLTMDASNRSDNIFFSNWPVQGFYHPDAADYFTVGGQGYLITANEGDARDYDGFSEEFRVGDEEIELDPTAFPDADVLKEEVLLGRLRITSANGDTDGDGDYDELYAYGGRSFAVWNAATGELLYDSGNDLEQITAADPVFGELFNTTDDENEFKNRSDDKGPEPEAVITAEIDGSTYGFVALERIGGVMAYDLSDPSNPAFLQYINTRTVDSLGGDLAPEGLAFIPADATANGKPLLAVSYEVSGSVAMFELELSCPIMDLPEELAICDGASATLEISGDYETIVWSNGQDGNTVTVEEAGTLNVMATTAGGCMTTDSLEVTVNPSPMVSFPQDTVLCSDEAPFVFDPGMGNQLIVEGEALDVFTTEGFDVGTYSIDAIVVNEFGCEQAITFNFELDVCNSTRDLLATEQLKLFPNPTGGWATIELSKLQATEYDLSILSPIGQRLELRRIESQRSNFSAQIDLSDMPAGIYLVRLSSAEGVLSRRLIVE
jgi:hypothetical protein